MLGFFPDFYPDELLYSACARYHERLGTPRDSFSLRNLFGSSSAKINFDFPARLNFFVSQLPPGSNYTTDKIIQNNTALPYYAPFLDKDKVRITKRLMKGFKSGGKIHSRLGVFSSKIAFNSLRYCSLCVQEDRITFGETYWHRLHQLQGILACPKHKLLLNESGYDPSYTKVNERIKTAEEVITNLEESSVCNLEDQVLLRIAEDAEWVMKQENLKSEAYEVVQRFRYIVFSRGLGTYNGSVNYQKIYKLIDDKVPSAVLSMFNCSQSESNSWVKRIFNNSKASQPPVRYLLLMQVFNVTAKEFFKLPTEITPFGKKPFPCLNRASKHYKAEVIENIVIKRKQKSEKEVVGEFVCNKCGFWYRRHGPDETKNDRFKYSYVVKYGLEWDQFVTELYKNKKKSLEDISKQLKISEHVLGRQISRLNLPINKNYKKPKMFAKKHKTLEQLKKQKADKRLEWLEHREENPNYPRTKLQMSKNTLYNWLNRNDKKWLYENMPPSAIGKNLERKDWKKVDNKYKEIILNAVSKEQNSTNKPVFLCKKFLIRKLPGKEWKIQKLPKLYPKTNKAILKYSETREQFVLRRVNYYEKYFREIRIVPTFCKFYTLASVNPRIFKKYPKLEKSIKHSLNALEQDKQKGWV